MMKSTSNTFIDVQTAKKKNPRRRQSNTSYVWMLIDNDFIAICIQSANTTNLCMRNEKPKEQIFLYTVSMSKEINNDIENSDKLILNYFNPGRHRMKK